MADELEQMIASGFDEGDATAAPPDLETNSAGTADNAEATGEGSLPAPEGQPADQPFRWENVPPELEPLAKGFQADYTRKSQELAEQRKTLEAQAQQYQALQQLAEADPRLAEQLIRAHLGLTDDGAQAATSETDPYAQIEPVNDNERFLIERNRVMEARLAQQEQFFQQQVQRQNLERIGAEFAALEKQVGREIPAGERDQIATACIQRAVQLSDGTWQAPTPSQMFREVHWEAEMTRAMQRGRDEAASVVQQKASGAPAPSGIVNRTPNTLEFPSDPGKLVEFIYDRMNG